MNEEQRARVAYALLQDHLSVGGALHPRAYDEWRLRIIAEMVGVSFPDVEAFVRALLREPDEEPDETGILEW